LPWDFTLQHKAEPQIKAKYLFWQLFSAICRVLVCVLLISVDISKTHTNTLPRTRGIYQVQHDLFCIGCELPTFKAVPDEIFSKNSEFSKAFCSEKSKNGTRKIMQTVSRLNK